MVWKNLFVGLLISALVSCQPIVPSNPMVSTSTVQPRVTNPDTSSTDYRIFIDHMSVKDLFEGAVMIGKYDALQYYGSPKEAYSFLCCRMAESLEVEEYSRHADWISHFELDMLTPLSLEPYSPLRLNDADIENGNLVFVRQARAWQTQDSLLAIENGKLYFNYLILSHTKDGWRIAEINSAYPTENLLGNWSSDATATAQMPSSNAYLETIASHPDTYLSLARVSGLLGAFPYSVRSKSGDVVHR